MFLFGTKPGSRGSPSKFIGRPIMMVARVGPRCGVKVPVTVKLRCSGQWVFILIPLILNRLKWFLKTFTSVPLIPQKVPLTFPPCPTVTVNLFILISG